MRTTTALRRRRGGRIVAALVVAGLGLAACGGDDGDSGSPATTAPDADTDNGTETTTADGDDPPPASSGGTLRVANPTAPSTLDPVTGNSGFDHIILYPMFDTLVEWDAATLEAIPGLATSWEFTDELTLVMQLRDDVTFHDGTPFDGEAAKYNLDRAKTWENSNLAGDLQSVDNVEVTGDYEITLNLLNPDTALPLILSDRAGMMSSPTAAEELGLDFGINPVGSGPFVFDEYLTGDVVTMNRNPDYWGEQPSLDRIEFRIMADADTRLNAMISGDTNFTYGANPRDIERLEQEDGLVVDVSPGLYHDEFYVNLGRPPFDDVRVREAMAIAIDREALNEAKQYGAGEPSWGPLPSAHWAFPTDLIPTYEYDPERARELLAEAGYADGLTIEVVGWSNDVDIRHAEILQSQLNEVGITMEVTATEVPQATALFFNEKRFDAYLAAWTGRPDPSLTFALLFSKDGYFNAAAVETPGLEDAIRNTRSIADLGERTVAFEEASRIVADEVLYIPLTFPPDMSVYSTAVSNYTPNLLGKPKLAFVQLND